MQIFRQLEKEFGRRIIDLFGLETNRQTPLYYSLNHEESAKGTVAMSHHWPSGAYAYPPFILLNRILTKIHNEKTKDLVLVTSSWTIPSWWAELQASTARRIQITKPTQLTLSHICLPAISQNHSTSNAIGQNAEDHQGVYLPDEHYLIWCQQRNLDPQTTIWK
jgi:hypothetical protein